MPRLPYEGLPCTAPDDTQYWNSWAQLSPYSPYNLRHLPQPVPSDLPSDVAADAHLFGFDDAFEDLLAATATASEPRSRPRPLMDLRRQADYKRRLRSAFHQGEPPMLWVQRLTAQRLLQKPLPPAGVAATGDDLFARLVMEDPLSSSGERGDGEQHPAKGHQADEHRGVILQQIGERWKQAAEVDPEERRRQQDRLQEQFEKVKNERLEGLEKDASSDLAGIAHKACQLVKEWVRDMENFNRKAAEGKLPKGYPVDAWSASKDDPEKKSKAQSPTTDEMWLDLESSLNDLEDDLNELDELVRAFESSAKEQKQEHQPRQPETDDDLFSAIESAVAEADKSFKSFVKTILGSDDEQRPVDKFSWPSAPSVPSSTDESKPAEAVLEYDRFGGKTVKSTTEHVDVFGHVHQKTQVKKVDAWGHEVSCETHYSIRPGPEKQKQVAKTLEETLSPASAPGVEKEKASNNTEGKISGWFWR